MFFLDGFYWLVANWVVRIPTLESAGFGPKGQTLAFTYNNIFILQYSRRGNRIRQQGVISYYFQIIETATGKNVLTKPYKTKMRIEVLYNDGENVWLQSMDTKKGKTGLAIFNIRDRKMSFTAEEIERLNPGIVLDAISRIFVDKAAGRVAAIGTDGRYYSVNAQSGKCTLWQGEDPAKMAPPSELKKMPFEPYYAPILLSQLIKSVDGYRSAGNKRGPLTKDRNLSSKEDFLEPGFVLAKPGSGSAIHDELMDYKDHLFVCSKITTDNEKDLLLTMVCHSDLSSVWTITLPALKSEQNKDHKPLFQLAEDRLFVVNGSHLIAIDVPGGKIVHSQLLFKQ